MNFISHRGLWFTPEEKNTKQSFIESYKKGWGVEFDVRDYKGNLVISHDIPKEGAQSFEDFLMDYVSYGPDLPLAINIKSDGLQSLVKEKLDKFSVHNYFVFDASIPDLIAYKNLGIKFYNRLSEYETPTLSNAEGIWLDQMQEDFLTEDALLNLVDHRVCFVSGELHKRQHLPFWGLLKNYYSNDNWSLCTDYPVQAREFFES
jgi:hypothetical protein